MVSIKELILNNSKFFPVADNATQIDVNGKKYYPLLDVAKSLNNPYVITKQDIQGTDASFGVSFPADYTDTPILLTYEDHDVNGSQPSPYQAVTISSQGKPVSFTFGYSTRVALSYKNGVLNVSLKNRGNVQADSIIKIYKIN